jgi:hypothetical protein
MNKKIILSLSILTIFIVGFIKEDSILQQFIDRLTKFTTEFPQEKVHLHLDKPYYAIGEQIWLKGYIVTAEKNEPSALSKVLYVDLIDEANVIRQAIRLPINNGRANGHILLSDTLKAGVYRIRSYTNYMRNFDANFFFEKQLNIGDIFNIENAKQVPELKTVAQLDFFPEGGNLIGGIRSKVGIKATTKDGKGVNVSGFITDETNSKVALFTTEHAGMGAFAINPQLGKKYKAYIVNEDGKQQEFNFPEALTSGYTLAINTLTGDDNLIIKIAASADLVKGQMINIIGQSNGKVYYSSSTKVTGGILTATISKKTFPTGIVQFTAITDDKTPVAERLVFINHNDQLKININPENNSSPLRSKANFGLMVTDYNNNPIDGNFSISVTDIGKVPFNENEETTILSNLLLTADLKGFIEQPNYYFTETNQGREQHLDHLLLTQGWTRFVWKDLLKNAPTAVNYRVEESLEISGKITSLENKPLPNVKVILLSTTPGFNLLIDTVSNSEGKFIFDKLDFPDTVTFLVRAKDDKLANSVRISLNNLPKPKPSHYLPSSINIQSYLESTKLLYEEQSKYNVIDGSIRLREVKITGQKAQIEKTKASPFSANKAKADYVITKDKLKSVTNLFDAFYSFPGIYVRGSDIVRSSVRTVSITAKDGKPKPMAIFLDGQRYRMGINDIPPTTVESIEILTSLSNTTIYGDDGYWGVIVITTKRLDPGEETVTTNILKVNKNGYALVKEFYMPNYDDPKVNRKIQDLRSTIYWAPNINTAANGRGNFSFFTASTQGKYRIVIEGMDNYGDIGRKTFIYTVQ